VSDRLDCFGVFFSSGDAAFGSRRSFLFVFSFFIFVQGIV